MKRRLSVIFLLLLLFLLCLRVHPALAQTVGGSCSTSGQTTFTSYGLLACNGSNWELAKQWYANGTEGYVLQNFGNDAGSCTAAKKGELIYAGGSTWEYCDGSNWQPI